MTLQGIHTRAGGQRASLDRVRAALDAGNYAYTQRGNHIQASCPAHPPDRNPSLSVDYDGRAGRTRVHCHHDDSSDLEVLEILGLTPAELYDDWLPPDQFAEKRARERAHDPKQGRKQQRPTAKTAKRRPALPKGRLPARLTDVQQRPLGEWQFVETHDYHDNNGQLIHQEVRHQRPVEEVDPRTGEVVETTEKQITQRWPDNKGGWLKRAPRDFEPVLYRLPDLAGWISAGRLIWLCEGAKDANRFLAVREAATTNPSGAANFKQQQAASLTGAHVAVVLDHDLAGYRRGRKLGELLSDVASLRFVLPATSGLHSDASDHFDAGYGLSDFVEVSPEQLALLEKVAAAEDAARAAQLGSDEAAARAQRAQEVKAGTKKAEDERRFAARWAAEAGKQLVRATTALEEALGGGPGEEDLVQRLLTAVLECQHAVAAAHEAARVELPDELQDYLVEPQAVVDAARRPAEAEPDSDSNVVEHPTSARLPAPTRQVPMARGVWAYEDGGEGRRPRGVYTIRDDRWERVAPLPHVRARIVRRDGTGRRTGTVFLVAATSEGPGVIVGPDELRTATWANSLGMSLSQDDRIQRAAATAIIYAAEAAEEREATPRAEDGRISVPVPDTLPGSYLETAPVERDQALTGWRQIVELAAQAPRMALVMGAAAVAPYVAALGRQSHIVALYGDSDQGKSVTMHAAGAIWGDATSRGGVVRPWNSTSNGVTRYLGQLGVLPPFLDEAGQAGWHGPREWGKLIYDICEGAQRMGAEMRGLGVRVTMPWDGILMSAGNGRLTDGLGAGKYAGVGKRVIDIETPLTVDAEHAEAFPPLLEQAYGHMGHEILARHSADTVRPLIDGAAEHLGMPTGGNERTVARHLHAHLAGARILDEIAGTGELLYYAALEAATTYLEEWAAPQHDADRILEAVLDAMGREPAMWPTVAEYEEHRRPKADWEDEQAGGAARLPQHGINRTLSGIRSPVDDQGQWVAVFSHTWRELCEDLGVDSAVACRELEARNVLRRTDSARRRHEWTCQIKATGTKMYRLCLPDPDERPRTDDDPAPTAPESPQLGPAEPRPVADAGQPGCGSVAGEVAGGSGALTCEVAGVAGVADGNTRTGARVRVKATSGEPEIIRLGPDEPRPSCVVCGQPAGQLVAGEPVHLGSCLDRNAAPQQQASAAQHAPASPPANPQRTQAATVGDGGEAKEPRWRSPVAVVDEECIYLPEGEVVDWPECTHLGDLAVLAARDRLRLGHGGGETLPQEGQLWITSPAALERLGLPGQLELPDDITDMDEKSARRVTLRTLREYNDLPTVAAARDQGWLFGGSEDGQLDTWTYVKHPELLPGGVRLVFMPWIRMRLREVPLLTESASPQELADNLAAAAHTFGVQYQIHAGITAHRLIHHTRPPRRTPDAISGNTPNRIAVVKDAQSELPPFYRNGRDSRFASAEGDAFAAVESDFAWWRSWNSLLDQEKDCTFVHAYDRKGSYAAEWGSLDLGVEGLEHYTGAQAAWDGGETAGLWLIERDWGDWPEPYLPEPYWDAVVQGARPEETRAWVTTPTLVLLRKVGITPTVVESWRWSVHARYLEPAAQRLRPAMLHANPAVSKTAKSLYSVGTGRFGRTDGAFSYDPLWRPDWYDHIRAGARLKIMLTLLGIQKRGIVPLAAGRDSIVFASNERDPVKAWPGDPRRLVKPGQQGTPGMWQPEASGLLAEWGPEHLPQKGRGRGGRWHSIRAMEALVEHKKSPGKW